MGEFDNGLYDTAARGYLLEIDAEQLSQPHINEIRSEQRLYHAIRQLRPDFYLDGVTDYIVRSYSHDGEITRRIFWANNGELIELRVVS